VTVEEHGRRQRLTVRLTQHVFTDQAQPGANTFTHACDQHTTTLAAGFSLPEGEPVLVDTAASSRARGARWLVTNASSTQAAITKALICFSGYQIGAGPPSSRVTISEDDTWAHKQAIGKGTICINVRTTPAQASATVTLSGPNGYRSTSPKMTRLIDGARQFTSPITQQGNYTKTITVYDPAGNRTATTARTFTVTPPPQNGPPTQPACDAPTH
jgi:hypothetical protein